MAQQSHVPRFGDWGENVQYTTFFDNARRDRGEQKMINPNDPEQNPSAYTYKQTNLEKPRRPDRTINTTNHDNRFHHGRKNNRPVPDTYPPSSQAYQATKPANSPHAGTQHHRVSSVPKFGAWDETDPQSGDGFTVIFNKVKEQKQQHATTIPSHSHELVNHPIRNQEKRKTSSKSKAWTCFCL